jgi:16S rRNA (cytosine967-C5)-methyltransferase
VARLDTDVLNILRLGVYQLFYLEKIPPHAAVNETVELAKKSGKGFVNAILRKLLRDGMPPLPEKKDGKVKYLSVKYSVPRELCRKFLENFSDERTEAIFAAFLCPPPITLHANLLRTSRDELIERLAAEGISAHPTANAPYGVRLDAAQGLPDAIFRGDAYVQDEASQICIAALDPREGDRVLDACSCPGTKAFSAAMRMKNAGEILACDKHASKLSLIETSAARLGISIISARERDSSVPDEALDESFDRVLCDVPCSGFGVIAKKPDIRYKSEDDITRLPVLQAKILETNANYLKSGGTLVYSTCTINPAENKNIVESFLKAHPEFSLCPFRAGAVISDGMLEIMPYEYDTDGFFIAKLRKN